MKNEFKFHISSANTVPSKFEKRRRKYVVTSTSGSGSMLGSIGVNPYSWVIVSEDDQQIFKTVVTIAMTVLNSLL